MSDDSSELNLESRLRSKDPKAQQEFIDKYKEQICRAIRIRLGCARSNQKGCVEQAKSYPDSRVESLFNESLIKFLDHIGGREGAVLFAKEENIVGYVFRIAQNIIIDRDRRRRIVQFGGIDSDSRIADTGKSPSEEVEMRDLASKVQQMISSLPEEEQTLINQKLGFQDAEDRYDGSKLHRSRSKLYRIRQKLRGSLG